MDTAQRSGARAYHHRPMDDNTDRRTTFSDVKHLFDAALNAMRQRDSSRRCLANRTVSATIVSIGFAKPAVGKIDAPAA